MAKAKKKPDEQIALRDNPRAREQAIWNRIRLAVEHEVIDRAWGCPLYVLHRTGWITNEQREAGDRYQKLAFEFCKLQDRDPDLEPEVLRRHLRRHIERTKLRWQAAIEILGLGRKTVDAIVMEENFPGSEREKYILRDALQLLANFFRTGRRANSAECDRIDSR